MVKTVEVMRPTFDNVMYCDRCECEIPKSDNVHYIVGIHSKRGSNNVHPFSKGAEYTYNSAHYCKGCAEDILKFAQTKIKAT